MVRKGMAVHSRAAGRDRAVTRKWVMVHSSVGHIWVGEVEAWVGAERVVMRKWVVVHSSVGHIWVGEVDVWVGAGVGLLHRVFFQVSILWVWVHMALLADDLLLQVFLCLLMAWVVSTS